MGERDGAIGSQKHEFTTTHNTPVALFPVSRSAPCVRRDLGVDVNMYCIQMGTGMGHVGAGRMTTGHRRTSGLNVGGVSRPLCWCEHVDEEVICAVGLAVGHRDENSAFEPIWIGSRGIVIQSGSDGFGSGSSHLFRSGGGDVGVGFSLISSVNMYTDRDRTE